MMVGIVLSTPTESYALLIAHMWTAETADVISLVLGSPVSNNTPLGSSLTNKARPLSEFQAFVTLLLESPKVTTTLH